MACYRNSAQDGNMNRHVSIREQDGEKERQRRRIAVAVGIPECHESLRAHVSRKCSRCRKRKIKCSGDLGNGQGCMNCKNAGTDPSQCQFLRVNSGSLEYGVPQIDWPYLMPGLGSNPLVSSNIVAGQPGPSQPLLHPLNTSITRLLRTPTAGSQSCLATISPNFCGFGPADLLESYYQPTAACFSQTHDSAISTEGYGTHEARTWDANPSSAVRPPLGSLDPDLGATRSPYFNLGITTQPNTSESPSSFPGMGSLVNSLPSSVMGHRFLPNPRGSCLNIGQDSSTGTLEQTNFSPSLMSSRNLETCWDSVRPTTDVTSDKTTVTNVLPGPTEDNLPPPSIERSSSRYSTTSFRRGRRSAQEILTPRLEGSPLSGQPSLTNQTGSYTYRLGNERRPSHDTSKGGALLNGQSYTHLTRRSPPSNLQAQEHHQNIASRSDWKVNVSDEANRGGSLTPVVSIGCSVR